MRACRKSVFTIFAVVFLLNVEFGNCIPEGSDNNLAGEPRFRIARLISGSMGSRQQDRYVIQDPRSVFYIPHDRQVVVYLELEGPTGMHRIEGLWKDPSGKIATISDFNYESRERRFSAHFTLALLESAETGTWNLETRIDGEYVGTYAFQLVADSPPEDAAPPKRLLGPAEIYQKALSSMVLIGKIGSNGQLLGIRSGCIISPTTLLTSFQAVDGASKIRVTLPDGELLETGGMLTWSRKQDWVTISVDAGKIPALPIARPDSWNIGDTVSYLEITPGGNSVISEMKIVGKHSHPVFGDRINLSHIASIEAIGAPLLNEYGEVIGILGDSLYSGGDPRNPLDLLLMDTVGSANGNRQSIGVPITLVNFKQVPPTAVETLILKGESFPPLVSRRYVSYVQLTHKVSGSWPVDSSTRFSHGDKNMTVFVMWQSNGNIKGRAKIQLYDRNNRLFQYPRKIKDKKVDLKPGKTITSDWKLDVREMPVGIYRLDILLNDETAARSFIRIVP